MNFERGFKAWCETTALQVRRDLKIIPTGPLRPWDLASHLGIAVRTPHDIPGLDPACLNTLVVEDPSSWSAVTLSSGERDIIILNPAHSRARKASDLTHELSHILLAHEAARVDVAEDGSLVLFTYAQKQEDEANWLAGCLLLPREALLTIRRDGHDLKAAARAYEVSLAMLQYRLNVTGVERQFRRATQGKVARARGSVGSEGSG